MRGQGKVNIYRQLKQPLYWDKSYTPPLIPPFLLIHPSQSLPGLSHLIQAEINTWPLRQALNKQWREKHGPASRAKAPPSPNLPLSAQHKVNELPTFPLTSSNQQQRPPSNVSSPQGCSDVSIPAMIQTNAPSHSRRSLQADREQVLYECVLVGTSTGSMHAQAIHVLSQLSFSSQFLK